jgi:hypothetical protein
VTNGRTPRDFGYLDKQARSPYGRFPTLFARFGTSSQYAFPQRISTVIPTLAIESDTATYNAMGRLKKTS